MAEDIRFTIAGETLSYPADMAPYMACWKAGMLASMEASLQFIRQYCGLGSLRKFCADGYDAGRLLIARAVKDAVQRAVDAGHYDINETAFTALDGEGRLIRPWQEVFQQVYDQFVDLETEKLGEEERRRIRKDMRGRFTGGGFGLDAAIWASLEAGAVNLVTGAAHSVFNALGNLVTSVHISGKESDIYNNPDTLRVLVKALDRCVREAFVRILPQRVLGLSPSGVSREDLQRAAGIMDNILHGRIPQDKEPRLLLEVLRAMPVDRRAYAALAPHLTAFADRMALEEMKRFFLIPRETLAREAVSSALDGGSPADTEFFRRAAHGDWNAAALCGTELAVDGGRADEGMDLLWAAYAAGSADAFAAFLALRKQGRDVPFFPELLQRRADEGDPQALLALGRMYAAGKDGLPQDPEKAKDYFLRCFRGNDALRRADAACGLARLADTPEEAEQHLEAAAEGGRKDAAAALAARYTDKGDDLRAFHFLALFLSLPKEESFAPDGEGHIAFTGQAPDGASAALSLGLVFDHGAEAIADALDGLYDAPVLKPDKRRAAACYTRAARRGCPAAARLLAALLEEDGQQEDARRALEEAARAGDGDAAHRLGALYSADGPDRDAEKAIAAYRASLAAAAGKTRCPSPGSMKKPGGRTKRRSCTAGPRTEATRKRRSGAPAGSTGTARISTRSGKPSGTTCSPPPTIPKRRSARASCTTRDSAPRRTHRGPSFSTTPPCRAARREPSASPGNTARATARPETAKPPSALTKRPAGSAAKTPPGSWLRSLRKSASPPAPAQSTALSQSRAAKRPPASWRTSRRLRRKRLPNRRKKTNPPAASSGDGSADGRGPRPAPLPA